MGFEPKIGEELRLTATVIEAKTRHVTEVTRSVIALAIVIATVVALAVTAVICAYRGDFQFFGTLWAFVAAPLGWIGCYYFKSAGANGKEDDQSTA